jgi:hypothetical protein
MTENSALLEESEEIGPKLARHTVRRKDGTARPAAKIVYDAADLIVRLANLPRSRTRSGEEGEIEPFKAISDTLWIEYALTARVPELKNTALFVEILAPRRRRSRDL